jgi:hypothetical protein
MPQERKPGARLRKSMSARGTAERAASPGGVETRASYHPGPAGCLPVKQHGGRRGERDGRDDIRDASRAIWHQFPPRYIGIFGPAPQ